ncbi:LIM and calponin homology domains-containing protein 1-like [Sinocyclocheilus anshuiensis]|uniref:LIM and calponin homology domains-containing protein 1-like n=1 Tax=Sinocyclocheilus anshuiensis TaxID=1608454 RepID=UPI0007BADB53|nr:PREDICTED: LIM and calponin homology domains-containing protein 1-like [Sinocyclocheilus anshuiensis]
MSSDVNREAVFQATKVRTHLKQDGSWINRSQNVEDTQSDVKARKPVKLGKPKNVSSPESSSVSSSIMPCAESTATTSSSLDSSTPPQSSSVMSALRKFDAHPVLEDSRRAHVEKAVEPSIVKATEQPLKTPADASVKDIVEKPIAILAEEPLKTYADVSVKDIMEKPIAKPLEEPMKTHADAPKLDVVEKPIVKPIKEPLKTHADAPKLDVVEKTIVKPVEVPLKTHADIPKTDVVEKPIEEPLKTHADAPKLDVVEKPIVKPIEEPLKTHADTPKTDIVEKPVEEPLKTHAYTPKMYVVDNIVKPVEEPLETPTDVPVKNIVENPAEESLKTHTETPVEGTRKTPVDGASTDQTLSSGVLQEKAVKTLHENPAKPSGTLTTENQEDDTVEQVSIAHAPVVEAPFEPRQAENQPTSEHGELSLVSALEIPTTESSTRSTTEPTEEPRVAALEENHRLNSQAELNVKGKTMCSFCKLPIDGNVKISINIPAICCHPDCFKCNGCSSPLDDLSSSMYHYAGEILCEKCFDQIFQL